jgi:hypothetical protein
MSRISDLTEAYLDAKSAYERTKEVVDITKDMLMTELEKDGMKSIKTDRASVSIVKKANKVINEREVGAYLKEQPNIELDDFYITSLARDKVLAFAEHQLKNTGEIMPGISTTETEYLMVRENKKGKE